jgi:hypothetical protein
MIPSILSTFIVVLYRQIQNVYDFVSFESKKFFQSAAGIISLATGCPEAIERIHPPRYHTFEVVGERGGCTNDVPCSELPSSTTAVCSFFNCRIQGVFPVSVRSHLAAEVRQFQLVSTSILRFKKESRARSGLPQNSGQTHRKRTAWVLWEPFAHRWGGKDETHPSRPSL